MTTPVSARPSLEEGDRMDREEFHRRYEQRPDIRRAELVEGVVHVPSPMRYEPHDRPAALCVGLLQWYEALHDDVRAGANATLILDDRNETQPDAFVFRSGPAGPLEDSRGYLHGAPQLMVEVAASTAAYDLGDKMNAYRRNGVREYLVWRVVDGAIDVFRLEGAAYVRVEPGEDGIIESREFPGLRFDIPAMLRGDRKAAFAAIR